MWAEDRLGVDPFAPGLSLIQRSWVMWRRATLDPLPGVNPLLLDMAWLAYRGDKNALAHMATIVRRHGLPVHDAPKPNSGRDRKAARKSSARKARATA